MMTMKKPRALIVPCRWIEGNPVDVIDAQIKSALELINKADIDYDVTDMVVYDKDANSIRQKYNAANYDFSIIIIPTWLEPMLPIRAIKDFLNKPIVVWGFGTFNQYGKRVDMGSIPGSGVLKGTLREMGVEHEYLYYLPGNEKTDQIMLTRLRKIANVARAISMLDKAKIASIGYLFGGMTLGDIDTTKMNTVFGPELMEKDLYSLIREMESIDVSGQDYADTRKFVEGHFKASIGDRIDKAVRMYMVLKNYVDDYNLAAITVKCHFELSVEYGQTACIPLSVLGNSVVAACESDIPVLLTQLVMTYLSGGKSSAYVDLHEISEKGLLIGACGYAPSSMCIGKKIACGCCNPGDQASDNSYNGYITNMSHLDKGKVTIGRILKEKDGGFALHYTTGDAVGDIGQMNQYGLPQFAFTEVVLDSGVDRFAQSLGSHHYAVVYEDLRDEFDLFCRYKNIKNLKY